MEAQAARSAEAPEMDKKAKTLCTFRPGLRTTAARPVPSVHPCDPLPG